MATIITTDDNHTAPVPLPAVCFVEAVTGGLVILLGASSLQAMGTELQVLWSEGRVDTGLGVAQTRPVNKREM
jgi:hypothetical protein